MAWPRVKRVYHIGDEGKHLEELEEGTSHHERERDSIPALCGGNVSGEVFGQIQCLYQGCFKTRPVPVRHHERKKGTASQLHGEQNALRFGKDCRQSEQVSQGT